ncbi:hypothetical protein KUH32_00270 [Thalassococcus sp. CAU 1522]|uniref:DUF1127 domain-containing protein n=2 Tax=Thalassococcus arenae TaxID=2851652 RepID=A0ABS6N2E9_9RHOB|nr:hypothetical protein [Thalassococcus arenae]
MPDGLGQKLDLFFAAAGQGFNSYALRRARLSEVVALEAQSDGELARMGLRREDIIPHVFGDLLSPPA